MEANIGAALLKLLVCLSLCYVVSGSTCSQGYLFVNISRVPHCYNLTANKQCPKKLINYKVVDFDIGVELSKTTLAGVKATLAFFQKDTKKCHKALRKYTCYNMFAECIDGSNGGIMVKYHYNKTKTACADVKSYCSQATQAATINDCKNIMSNPMEFLHCAPLPTVIGDACPKSKYKYPWPSVKAYAQRANVLKQGIAQMQKAGMTPSCVQKYTNIACQINAGPICSKDGKLRMFAMNRQECEVIVKQCLSNQKNFRLLCRLLPDKNTAIKVPLPCSVVPKTTPLAGK